MGISSRFVERGHGGNVLSLIQHVFGVGIVAWFGFYLWDRHDILVSVLDISASTFALLAILVLVTWGLDALQNWILYRAAGISVGLCEMWQLNLASQ